MNSTRQPSHAGGTLGGWAVTNTFDGNLRRATVAATLSGAAQFTQGYGYDTAGRLQTATSGSFSAEYGYHANSPLVSTVSHRYGGNNRMVTTKQYDLINRLSSIANGSGDSHAYGYNAANQRTNVVRADGSYWVYAYDNLGQVISGKRYWSDGTPVAGQQHEYVFDDIGNRTSAKSGGNSGGTGLRTETYTRNRLNQYTQKTEANTFDVLGLANVSATVTVNGSSAYRKNEYFHREVSVSNGSVPVWQSVSTIASLGGSTTTNTGNMYVAKTPEVLTYDLDGNQLTDGRWSNTWDAENRLILQETIGTVPAGAKKRLIHEYDWMGRRIRKQVYDWVASAWSLVQDERFLYDGWNVIATLNSPSSILQTQLWGKDLSGTMQGAGGVGGLLAISHLTSSRTYFAGYDGNGNVTVLIDGVSGLTEGNFEYGPFGELIRVSGTAASVCPWRFSTKYEDAETGMLYYGYRFYNPNTGRWLSRDPIGERGGWNLTAFVRNDPMIAIDYLGFDEVYNGGSGREELLKEDESAMETVCYFTSVKAGGVQAAKELVDLHPASSWVEAKTGSTLSGQDGSVAMGLFGIGAGPVLKICKKALGLCKGVIVCVTRRVLNKSPQGLSGTEFESWLTKQKGGTGSFKAQGREFDGSYGDGSIWYEAKSGGYWDRLSDPDELQKFKSDMGDRCRIARESGKKYELHSNTPVPPEIKEWLKEKGIEVLEH